MSWTQIAVLVFLPVFGAMIVLKNDKQVVHILEGYLFNNKKDRSLAQPTYRKHLSPFSFVAIVFGFVLAAAGLVAGQDKAVSWASILGGIALAIFGAWQRMTAFRAAARELE